MEKQIEPDNSQEDNLADFRELKGLEEHVTAELLKICPLLSNQKFLNKYNHITEIAKELHLSSIIHYRDTGHFRYFNRAGVNNINDFLRKLNDEDWEALVVYKEVLGIISPR